MVKTKRGVEWDDLMKQARGGSNEDYERLLFDLSQFLGGFLKRWVNSETERQDLSQDILLSLHLSLASYNDALPFAPWFFSLIHRRAVDHIRRKSRNREEVHETLPEKNNSWVVQSERVLSELLERLTPKERDVFLRLYIEGIDEAGFAESKGISLGSLRVITHRLRTKIYDLLGSE